MKVTLSVLKADIGSIGGHICPSQKLLNSVRGHVASAGRELIRDSHVSFTGDDIAVLMTHEHGLDNAEIHGLAWEAFKAGTEVARSEGLYGAGQDLLKDAFSGNVRGMGPAVVELEFEERPGEPFLLFAADKTDPGAYNLPLYLAFADPMNTPGLLLSPEMRHGFTFTIMDVEDTEADRIIELRAPEQLYDIAILLRDPERYVIESVRSNASDEIAAAVSTSRLHNIAGKYTGKDDPVMLVRVQQKFPATGEVLAPFAIGHFVAGGMRGSHNMPLLPVQQDAGISYFDGPPSVSCAAFSMHQGILTEPADCFISPFWNTVRDNVSRKALEMRRQGFFGAAMLPMNELEYTGIVDRLDELLGRFVAREGASRGIQAA
ncbi:MAG TPA: fructose-1,6-bisphosphate aldolase/phosphatase [Woeseiaceae bacterium]|nr:fructose-1,6-bisphosphate aldolase/phosphatase [Woeseiaceae bacterium]